MNKIQIAMFFLSGFLISRLLIKDNIPQKLVYLLIGRKRMNFSGVIFMLISISAFLSYLIPNTITVLILLPVIEVLRISYHKVYPENKNMATIFGVCVIYGANIGGMGFITGTGANGILIGYAAANNIAGAEILNFAVWALWAFPLTLVFIVIAWFITWAVFGVYKYKEAATLVDFSELNINHPRQKFSVYLSLSYMISSMLLSTLIYYLKDYALIIIFITTGVTLAYIIILFFLPMKMHDGSKEKLLHFKDCYSNLPTKGLALVGVMVFIGVVVYFTGLIGILVSAIKTDVASTMSIYAIFVAIALMSSFTTELFSNTVIQISFFALVIPLAQSVGFSALNSCIIITLSSTCAFMSPLATGVNSLVFGEVKGVSLRKMLVAGFFMNIAGGLLISSWIYLFLN